MAPYRSYLIPQLLDATTGSVRNTQSNNPQMNPFYSALGATQSVPSSEYIASYNYDPAMAKIAALGTEDASTARNDATNVKRKAFIDAGAPDIAADYGADPNTIEAARQNPFSTLALLRRDAAQRNNDLTDALNAKNLFYSSEHQKQIGNQAFGEAQAESDFSSKLRELIAGADRGVLMAEAQDRANNPPLAVTPAPAPGTPTHFGGPGPDTVPHSTLKDVLGAGRGGDVMNNNGSYTYGDLALAGQADVTPGSVLADLARKRPPGGLRY
jgi:hypothetical protein